MSWRIRPARHVHKAPEQGISSGSNTRQSGSRRESIALASAVFLPVLAGVAGWTWAQLTTTQVECSNGLPLQGPGLGGSAVVIVLAAVPVVWLARRARFSRGQTVSLVAAGMVLSAFLIAAAIAVWEIGHHCAA